MKYELPDNHSLSNNILEHLIFKTEKGIPSLTDVQYEALESGIGNGESILVVSPTSTGKTQIAYDGPGSSLIGIRLLFKSFSEFRQIRQPFSIQQLDSRALNADKIPA